MERMAIHFEKENQVRHKVKTAMTYPIIIAIISVIVVIVLLALVVPTFVSMFEGMGAQLPMTTRLLLSISNFITSKWYLILIVVVMLIILVRTYLLKGEGRKILDKLKLSIPIIGLVNKKIIASRFTRTLSTLLSSGLPLLTSLEVVTKIVGNSIIAEGLERTQQQVSRGVSLAEPILEMNIFPPMVTNMIKIGEDSGALESILEKTADFYDGEVEAAVEQLTSLIEPVIIIAVALLVGFIVLSILQPIFSMYDGIGM